MTEPEPRDPRVDAAYRESATDEPRPELDERIRAAARRAVAAGPQSLEARARADSQRSWIARWRVPVSIAATVVVAVTLAYMMEGEEVRLARTDGVPASAPPPVVAQAEKLQPPAPAAASAAGEQLARRNAELESAIKSADAERRARAANERPVAAPAPAAATATGEPAAPEAFPAAPPAETRPVPSSPEAAPPSPASRAVPAAPAAPGPAREAAGAARERAFADRPERMERQAQTAEQKARTPEAWVEDLRRLKAQQRTEDFTRELAEFRKRYPDYKLPADLLQ
jgi:hypothetical protein